MLTILNYAQALVYTLMDLMPSKYQQKSLRALLGLFLEATGQSLPQHSQTVSASAISRYTCGKKSSTLGVPSLSGKGRVDTNKTRSKTAKNSAKSLNSTLKPLSAVYITRLGRRRWQIEGFFKTVKHRFGLHRFGQSTLLGVYRWLVLSFIAYFLAFWAYLESGKTTLPDWADAALLARETLLASLVVLGLLINIDRTQNLARQQGFDITVSGWQYG